MPEPRPTHRVPDIAEFDEAIRAYLERMATLRYADASVYLVYSGGLWPPPAESILAAGPIHGYAGRLIGFPDGHLAVRLERTDDTPPLLAEFQRVILAEDSRFRIVLVIKDERVALKVQGQQLGPYHPEQEPQEIRGSRA
jgi:hypothetical protein